VQSWNVQPTAIARYINVECIGVEVALDWLIVPSLTIPSGTNIAAAMQSIVANTTGIGIALRVGSSGFSSTLENPVSGHLLPTTTVVTSEDVVLAGETVRQACAAVFAVAITQGGVSPRDLVSAYDATVGLMVTVDFWGGLRVSIGNPADYVTLQVDDGVLAANEVAASSIDHETNNAGITRAVYVKGGNAAGTGLVSDGTGIPGPAQYVDDSSILTAAARDALAYAMLNQTAEGTRGSLTVENYNQATNIRAGSQVAITNTAIGLAAVGFRIMSIRKAFIKTGSGIRQNWDVAYGGLRPSSTRFLRNLIGR
jgi:hypothetical protein